MNSWQGTSNLNGMRPDRLSLNCMASIVDRRIGLDRSDQIQYVVVR